MQCRPLQWAYKMEYISMQFFMRYAFKQRINNYQIHFWPTLADFMTFEAKKSINLFSKSGRLTVLFYIL